MSGCLHGRAPEADERSRRLRAEEDPTGRRVPGSLVVTTSPCVPPALANLWCVVSHRCDGVLSGQQCGHGKQVTLESLCCFVLHCVALKM